MLISFSQFAKNREGAQHYIRFPKHFQDVDGHCFPNSQNSLPNEGFQKDTGDGIRIDQDERVQQIVAAVLLKSLGQESSAQLEVWESLMQPKGTSEGVG